MTDETTHLHLDSVEQALAAIAAGKPVIVVDDEDRENEGDLIFAAEHATPELVAFMVRYTSGYICVALTEHDADRLQLPPMTTHNEDARHTAYAVTVDAATGTTGISATNRAETIARLADPHRGPGDFTRPGHVVPLRARQGGVLERDGHTEASVDLARMAGCHPAGALCEIVSETDPTDMARGPELRQFANDHGLVMISIEQLARYRREHDPAVELVTATRLPTEYGTFTAHGVRDLVTGYEHVALVVGDVRTDDDVMVRVHSECLTGDVFASRRCDCGPQLQESLRLVQEAGRGVVIYLRGHEGRGIGLVAKLHAYELQDKGMDTVDANTSQGLPVDARSFSAAGAILKELGVKSVRLLSNNPHKCEALGLSGTSISARQPLHMAPTEDNIDYLRTKRDRLGHDLPDVARFDAEHEKRGTFR
ncbi:bifunctional 3,4-dihydroxy-2-butanone-4-phosphate synthase/GTP cyclohydrolase II [Corynebacterium tapiri]|uniref:Riboflavin biosynthesis protein RibBA n=1 Tax=Corynebacterium tapiri TaxID=1448266 RepID=A0A5C4U3S0_9CORY|nr:bifunctional 3,4-dihydroxy-2-butanone-4-phosphate synthase/GTP cyclohydrolase II [Corynebacterium tapiri]TNL97556.1 bifunctional 3,4-dihydroxy-2-butanone-4-phosphate synthase/GTP cyclohydrolase II [Corynebacterium tapiri]